LPTLRGECGEGSLRAIEEVISAIQPSPNFQVVHLANSSVPVLACFDSMISRQVMESTANCLRNGRLMTPGICQESFSFSSLTLCLANKPQRSQLPNHCVEETMDAQTRTPNWKIIAAWAVVMAPFIWGLIQTVHSAIGIFGH